jgi:hypothetical protein
MSFHLPNFTNAPPGMWKYRVPETGQEFTNLPSLESVIDAVWQHYRANGYSVPSREELTNRIEEYVCQRVPAYCGDPEAIAKEETERGVPKDLRLTFHTVVNGIKTLGKWIGSGRQFVEQAQADKRAATCIECPQHGAPIGCTNCNMSTIHQAIELLVGKKRTASHDKLDSCLVCLCGLKVKCWVPLKTITDNMPKVTYEQLPETCWIKKEAA